jgi:hypothetical protein
MTMTCEEMFGGENPRWSIARFLHRYIYRLSQKYQPQFASATIRVSLKRAQRTDFVDPPRRPL